MTRTVFFWRLLAVVLCCAAVLALPHQAAAEKQIPATPAQSAMSMLPHLEWLLDSSGNLTVEDMASPQQQAAFRPLKLQDLPREAGTVWLRFTLAGRPAEVRPATLLLDMGDSVPDTPTLFVPKHNLLTGITEWQTFAPSQRTVFLMPETRLEPVTAYMRLDGLPGLWFSPMLRTPHNAATALERLARPAVIVALGVIMLLCLLRGLTERGEWRIWTSLYTAAALVHAVWGVPATAKGHVDMLNMAAVLAPGVGLMILPHVGRHLLRTRQTSRAIDLQLFLLSLPGAALALLPLLPGYSWTTRFLDLWPAGTLLLVPTTLGAWLCGLPGARRFLLGCLLPPAGVAVGILGMNTVIPASVLGTAPLWGLALGALIIAGTAAPQEHRSTAAVAPEAPSAQDLVDEDPNLRIVSPEELAQSGQPVQPAAAGDSNALALEESLRAPMDDLLRDGTALSQCALPPAARQLADAMLQSVHRMATALAGGPAQGASSAVRESVIFDLQEVLRQAHGSVSAVADSKNIALSWFMPPHLGQRYRGGVAQLGDVLRMLLESAVRATSRGAVQLAVRRVPESINPGHLLFSVTDTGTGVPPEDRSSVALARAWELAGGNRGFLGVECSPHGATISFTLHLELVNADLSAETEKAQGLESARYPGIIVVEDSPGERQLLAFFLEGLGATVVEARSADEAVELYMDRPADLLILDGDLPPVALHTVVERVRTYEKAQGTTPALIMGLSSDDAQWEVLRAAGFTHALPKPVTRSGLRSTVCQLLPQCAAQESLTPEMDMSCTLPSLPLPQSSPSGDMTGDAVTGYAAAQDADDGEIIDTGMPLLEMDTRPASPEAASPIPPATDVASPHRADVAGQGDLLAHEPLRMAGADAGFGRGFGVTAEEPLRMEPVAPVAPAAAKAVPDILSHSREHAIPDLFSVETPAAPQADVLSEPEGLSQPDMGLQLSPLHEGPVTRSTGQHGKSHADYLTSLLDGEDDLVRRGGAERGAASGADGRGAGAASTAEVPMPEDEVLQAVREDAYETLRKDTEGVAPAAVQADAAAVDVVDVADLPLSMDGTASVELAGDVSPSVPQSVETPAGAGMAEAGADVVAEAAAESAADEAEGTPAPEGEDVASVDLAPAVAEGIAQPHAELPVEDAAQSVTDTPVEAASATLETHPEPAQAEIVASLETEERAVAQDAVAEAFDAVPAGTEVFISGPVPSSPAAPSVAPAVEAAPVLPAAEPMAPAVEEGNRTEHDTVEWVGEPRPLTAPQSSAEAASEDTAGTAETKASTVQAPSDATEWVGEPRPMAAPAATAETAPPLHSATDAVRTEAPRTDAPLLGASSRGPVIGSAYGHGRAYEAAVEWVGEPRPVERHTAAVTDAAPSVHVPQQDVAEMAPAPTPEPRKEEHFVPLSMHASTQASAQAATQAATQVAMAEPSPSAPKEDKGAVDRAHLTLLPQSTPLLDFIIAEPVAVAVPPAAEPVATPAPTPAAEEVAAPAADPASADADTGPDAKPKAPSVSTSVRISLTPRVTTAKAAAPAASVVPATPDTLGVSTSAAGLTPTAAHESLPLTMSADVASSQQAEPVQAVSEQAEPEQIESGHTGPEKAPSAEASGFVPGAGSASAAPEGPLPSRDSATGTVAPSSPGYQPATPAAAASTAARQTADMLRASYGSVGEPTPIAKPGSAPTSQEMPLARLLDYFDQAVQHARQSFEKRDTEGVHEGAAYIARQADKVGLRTLARMARCVADAGKAGDMDAVKDLLPELESTVERNRIALGG